ncbi:MAG: hypothetical protein KJZ83_01375 [Burkholderiaceae bacterium]|nr:hypothetical protein [Burkholderiaceae bacterium]
MFRLRLFPTVVACATLHPLFSPDAYQLLHPTKLNCWQGYGLTHFWTPDRIDSSVVFTRYGQNAWGTGGAIAHEISPTFIGLSFNENQNVGGVVSECIDYVGCTYWGAEARIRGAGAFGANYAARFGGGALDIRYPVKVSLDLPYGANGTNVPDLGDIFTIGSSWSVNTMKVLSSPGNTTTTTPFLGSTGPYAQAFVDLVAYFDGAARGRICVHDCLAGGPSFDFDKSREILGLSREGDGVVRVWGSPVTKGSPGELAGGVIKYYANLPVLNATGGLGADLKTLTTSTQDQLAGIGIGIDEIVTQLLGVPMNGSFGFSFAGEYIGVGYNIFDAAAWLNLLIRQQTSFVGKPMIDLEFSSPVQVCTGPGPGQCGPDTKKVTFEAGTSIQLRNTGAQLLGVVPTYRLLGTATNDTDLPLTGEVNLSALGLTSTLGDLGPLVKDWKKTFDIASIDLLAKTFGVNFEHSVGGAFNMLFNKPEGVSASIGSAALTYWDIAQWSGCFALTAALCGQTPQSQVIGFYPFLDAPTPDDPDGVQYALDQQLFACLAGLLRFGCDEDIVLALIDERRFLPLVLSSPRALDDENGSDVYLNLLAGLFTPEYEVNPGISDEEVARNIAALREAFAPQPFVVPPAPMPAPGTVALLVAGLAVFAVRRGVSRSAH